VRLCTGGERIIGLATHDRDDSSARDARDENMAIWAGLRYNSRNDVAENRVLQDRAVCRAELALASLF
jgi:hypothetical protein